MNGDDLDEILRALARPARRAFLRACLTPAQAAGDLSALSDLSRATVSGHLKALRKTGPLQLDRQVPFWRYWT